MRTLVLSRFSFFIEGQAGISREMEGNVSMYPEVIRKMAFSKEHKDLLLKLYNKEITRREYDHLVQLLYRPTKEAN